MKKSIASFAILFCISLFFFWPLFKGYMPFPGDLLVNQNPYRSLSIMGFSPGSYPNKAQGKDVITQLYPWKYFSVQEMKHGRIPFWNPYNFSGNILMQNFQSAVFNPTNIFFFFLSFPLAWTLFIFIQPILASYFFYVFARELRVGRFASVIGGVGFAFSSYMTVWIEYGNISSTLAYLPLLLFFILKFLRTKRIIFYIGFIVAASFMILSGYIQVAFYCYSVAFFFTIFSLRQFKIKISPKLIFVLLSMFILPIFLTMMQLLSTYQIFLESTRWPYSVKQFQNILEPLWYWVTLFASDFFGNPATRNYFAPHATYIERVAYIGIPLLIFAIVGIIRKREFTWFFVAVAFIVFLLTTNLPGIAYLYRLPIPVINTTVPTRMLSIFMFAAVMLATFGIDEFFKKKYIPKQLIACIIAVYILLWTGVFIAGKMFPQFFQNISVIKHNLIIPTLLAFGTLCVILIAKKYKKVAMAILAAMIIGDLFYGFHKITPFAPVKTVYPANPITQFIKQNAGINRYWGYGSGYIEPNYQTVDKTYSPEGNDALHIKNYGELLGSSFNGKIPLFPGRPDANLVPGYGNYGMVNPYRQRLLNLLGVKYIVQHDELRPNGSPDTQIFPRNTYALVSSNTPWQIYENKEVLPRYFLTNSYVVANGQKALDALYSIDVRKKIILSKKITDTISASSTGSVQLISYDSQKIVFLTKTNGTMLLFLSDTFFPSWVSKVDKQKSTHVLLADYAFRALVVPKGEHTITMYYYPRYFIIGLWISIISCLVFILGILYRLKHAKQK